MDANNRIITPSAIAAFYGRNSSASLWKPLHTKEIASRAIYYVFKGLILPARKPVVRGRTYFTVDFCVVGRARPVLTLTSTASTNYDSNKSFRSFTLSEVNQHCLRFCG